MPTEIHDVSVPAPSISTVPRAVWVGGGLLAVVSAGLAGALIMKPAGPAQTAAVVTPAPTVVAASAVPQPVPLHARTSDKPARGAIHSVTSPGGTAQASRSVADATTRAALCTSCGTVESVSVVQEKGQGTGLGAVAGGVLGGVVGNQIGGGNGKTAMTVLGAIGGGLAGNEVEKRARGETLFDVHVRMENGGVRVFRRAESMAVGTSVVVEGTTLRMARDAGRNDVPRTVRTSAPVGAGT